MPFCYDISYPHMWLNVNLQYPSKNTELHLFNVILMWATDGLSAHSAYVTYTSYKTPFGVSVVTLRGRSVTWNGSISAHITEHIPYKAMASVYSLPPYEALASSSGSISETVWWLCSLFPCEPCYARWLEHLCQWLRGQMEQQRTFWRGYGN